MQKATPIAPPMYDVGDIVEVDMTKLYLTVGALTVTTAGLAGVTTVLWRRVRREIEYREALSEYIQRLVNRTDCGYAAYQSFVEDDEAEEAAKQASFVDEEGLVMQHEDEEVDA